MHKLLRAVLVLAVLPLCSIVAQTANRAVYLDKAGVVRWSDDKSEVALFGANYVVTTASDYRAAGYVGADRKKMIDEDMAHFARMASNLLRPVPGLGETEEDIHGTERKRGIPDLDDRVARGRGAQHGRGDLGRGRPRSHRGGNRHAGWRVPS